jgi:nucleoredoxin
MEGLFGNSFVSKNGEVQNPFTSSVQLVGVYFSAHWCPPCRGFTPVLAEVYNEVNKNGKVFEVVFVSCDSDEASFKNYLASMPWVALPFGSEQGNVLNDKFQVSGIPRLVLLRTDGSVAVDNARNMVTSKKANFFDEVVNAQPKVPIDPALLQQIKNGVPVQAK